jgi:hypothetical protein
MGIEPFPQGGESGQAGGVGGGEGGGGNQGGSPVGGKQSAEGVEIHPVCCSQAVRAESERRQRIV